MYTKHLPYFAWLREQFYPNGAKCVNRELVSEIDDFGIAVWFLDDGNTSKPDCSRPRAGISVGTLPLEDVEWLCKLLTDRGYDCKPLPHDKVYLRIQFDTESTVRLLKSIAKYVPPSMRYKLIDGCDSFEPEWYESEKPVMFWDSAIVEEAPIALVYGRWEK